MQEGNLDNLWSGLGAVLSLVFVYIAIQKDFGLIGFVTAFLSGPMVAYLASNLHYFSYYRRDLRPQLPYMDRAVARNLFFVGGMFLVLQVSGAIQVHANNVIIASLLGPSAVTSYAICMQLTLMVPTLFGLILTPLWPAYREALARGDKQWVMRIFLKSMRWALFISIPSAAILILLGDKVIMLWVGQEVVPSTGLLIGCGIWLIWMTVGNTLGAFLNGLQLVKVQMVVATTAAVINVILSIWLIRHFGVVGAIYGSVISYLVFTLLPYYFYIRKILSNFVEQPRI